jgi:hypothetical protein
MSTDLSKVPLSFRIFASHVAAGSSHKRDDQHAALFMIFAKLWLARCHERYLMTYRSRHRFSRHMDPTVNAVFTREGILNGGIT